MYDIHKNYWSELAAMLCWNFTQVSVVDICRKQLLLIGGIEGSKSNSHSKTVTNKVMRKEETCLLNFLSCLLHDTMHLVFPMGHQ